MHVTGVSDERIGTVERFEIDSTGQLKSLVVQTAVSTGAGTLGARKRIAAEKIRSIRDGAVQVAVSAAEVRDLADATDDNAELESNE